MFLVRIYGLIVYEKDFGFYSERYENFEQSEGMICYNRKF
jgi:hypothetical protein